ncbi:hypothetical protein F7P74_06345 [Helicobacter pullorum NCTC 12824]|uniref:hypothetical protein n=2 Tax=Helicobacter pullorum TaxID=35818 RepID=UPI001247A5E4|nr:hypothetical protein [Helicobacter pullorum]KAB0574551.1 hypothetical protein F7P74_06345 [Helicobacter pullorum NCTC 12824]
MSLTQLYTQKAQLEKEIEKLEQDKSYNEKIGVAEGADVGDDNPLEIVWTILTRYNSNVIGGISGLVFYDKDYRICSVPYITGNRTSANFILRLDGNGKIPTSYSGNGGGSSAIPSSYQLGENEIQGSISAPSTYSNGSYYYCYYPLYQNPGSQWSWNASSVGATLTYTLPKNAFSKFSFQGNPHCGLAKYRVTIKLGGAIIHNQEYSGATRNEIAIAYFPSQAHKDLKLKEIIDSIAAKTEELNQTLSAINAILDNASLELETSKENLAQKEQELTKKQEELAQKEAENEAVLKEIESLKAQEAQLQEQIKQLEEQIANAGSADNEELESLRQSIAELEAQKALKEQELQNANANLESLKAKKAELESQIANLEAQAQELQEQINLHNQEIPKLETRKHYAELKVPENEALLEQKKQAYKELAEAINALNREIKALSDEIKAKEAEITTLRAEKTGLEEQKENAEEIISQKEAEIAELQRQIEELQKEDFSNEIEALEKRANALREEIARLRLLKLFEPSLYSKILLAGVELGDLREETGIKQMEENNGIAK